MEEDCSAEGTSRPDGIEISFARDTRERTKARYVSATTVYEERLEKGRLIGVYWSSSGYVHNTPKAEALPGFSPLQLPLDAFQLEVDGQSLHNRWRWVSATQRSGEKPGTVEAVIELEHRLRPVALNVVTRLDGTPFLTRWLDITNTCEEPIALSRISPWSGLLFSSEDVAPLPSDSPSRFTLGYFDSMPGYEEGNLIWQPLPKGSYRVDTCGGRGCSGHGGPYFIVRNESTGECAIGALAWPFNWFVEFWHDPWEHWRSRNRGPNLAFRMGPMGLAPLRIIALRETVRSPEIHLGMLHKQLDACVYDFHDHLRTSVIPPRPKGRELFTITGGNPMVAGDWFSRQIDTAAEMGAETFVVDGGWYGEKHKGWPGTWTRNRGDWTEGDWLPDGGLAGLRDHIHQKGMLFGLWMEPEAISGDSRLFREHPDWIQTADEDAEDALWELGDTTGLDFTRPEVAQYAEDCVFRALREYGPDYFKLDYNIDTGEGGTRVRDGYAEHEQWRHYEVLRSMFTRVRQEFPDMVMENCAGGGGRNDLGMLGLFHIAAESDRNVHPYGIRAINGLTLFIPPEALVYYHHHQDYLTNHFAAAHRMADLETHLRVTLFANTYYVYFGALDADRSTRFYQRVKRYIKLAKEVTTPILAAHPNVYHHTPDIGLRAPADWCVLEYASRDASAAYAGVFRLGGASAANPPDEVSFRPRGLDPQHVYDVSFDNTGRTMTADGADLMTTGLPIRLDMAYTSELLIFQKQAAAK